MFFFRGTRTPNFRNIKPIDYDAYWRQRGFELRGKLMEREKIFFDWIRPGSAVVDIGCGNSRLLYELKSKKKCRVLGLDASRFAVAGQNQAGVRARVEDFESKNLALQEKFDYAIMSELLEHLREPENLISRILSHTQYCLISVPNSAFYRYRLGLMFKGRFFTQWAQHPAEHLRYWSHRDFLDWLDGVGLTVLEFRASNGFWWKNILPNLFGHQICYFTQKSAF
ncbi:MAG: methyltransferase domain-containing protein [Candidatus Doudnabacteria bacterium]|nr:methyltransferase domain-containing protein [Candidatus Doudnabacteria bacterium]